MTSYFYLIIFQYLVLNKQVNIIVSCNTKKYQKISKTINWILFLINFTHKCTIINQLMYSLLIWIITNINNTLIFTKFILLVSFKVIGKKTGCYLNNIVSTSAKSGRSEEVFIAESSHAGTATALLTTPYSHTQTHNYSQLTECLSYIRI